MIHHPLPICSSCGRAGRGPHTLVSRAKSCIRLKRLHRWFELRQRCSLQRGRAGSDSLLKHHGKISHRWWASTQTYSPSSGPSIPAPLWQDRASYPQCPKPTSHSWINTEYLLLQYKCTLKSHTAILPWWADVSKTSGLIQSLWNNNNNNNNNKESLIGFHWV